MSTSRAEYECFQIELSKNYGMSEWREDVKKVLLKAGLQNLPITFLFSDTQVPVPGAAGKVHSGLGATRCQGSMLPSGQFLTAGYPCQWAGSCQKQAEPLTGR